MSVVGHLVILPQLLPCTYFILSVVVKDGFAQSSLEHF